MKKVEITIPVYNEEAELERNVLKLWTFCKEQLGRYAWHITIADNASTDHTSDIGKKLAAKHSAISLTQLAQKGRGNAVKTVWKKSNADICVYMDIDLSTDLSYLPPLVQSLEKDFDIAIGSRLKKGARVIQRSVKRELISRMYNLLIKILFQTRFSDAQCGFKAVSRKVASELLPKIVDDKWFMDTELLIMGEKSGYRIHEEAVVWTDNPGSTVRVLPTIMGDLEGLARLFFTHPWMKIHPNHVTA